MQPVRTLSIFLLVLCHMQAIVPAAAPASLVLFAACHFDRFRLYRKLPQTVTFAALFLGYCLFLLLIHGMLRDYSLIEILRTSGRLMYMVGVFLLAAHLRTDAHVEKPLFYSTTITAAAISVLAIISCYVTPLSIAGMPLSTSRSLTGFFENHNTMAGAVGVALLMTALAWLHGKQHRMPVLFNRRVATLAAVLALAFALCLSRAYSIGMLAACGGIAWMIPRKKLRRQAYVGGIAAGAALAVFVVINRSAEIDTRNVYDRTYLYQRAVREVIKSPLVGIGPSAFQELHGRQRTIVPNLLVVRQSGVTAPEDKKSTHDIHGAGGAHVHNTYLQLLCDYGLIGAGLLTVLSFHFWRGARQTHRTLLAEDDPPLELDYADWNAKLVLGSFVFLAVAGLFVNWCFSSPPYTLVGYVSLGRFTAWRYDLSVYRPVA